MPYDKLERLQDLYTKWAGCERCGLCASRRNMVFADGAPGGPILLLGERPNYQEDKYGKPLLGPPGKLIGEIISNVRQGNPDAIIDEMIHVTNLVMCRPPKDRSPTPDELDACWPRLRDQIRIVDPWLIITLGGTALNLLVANSKKKMPKQKKVRGVPAAPKLPPMSVLKSRGEVVDIPIYFPGFGSRSFPVLPMLQPNYLLQRPDMNEGGELKNTVDDFDVAFKIIDTLKEAYERGR